MNCLCCGKPIKGNNEKKWHNSCIKKFFGTSVIPKIEINDEILEAIAMENTSKGVTVPGVQKKLSLQLFSTDNKPQLSLVNYPTGYILKPQVKEFTALPEAEFLVMCMADITGISTVPHGLIQTGESLAYITKRIDRIFENNTVKCLAMEDFCQLDLRLTQDKYLGSYERCAKVIERYSFQKNYDLSELFMRLVFSFVVGNSDMHLKNFSLIEIGEGSEEYVLSPAYDLLPVNIVMPEDTEQFALAINGKKTNIRRKDFLVFAEKCNISKTSAEKMIEKIVSLKQKYIEMCRQSLMPKEYKEALIKLIEIRCDILRK